MAITKKNLLPSRSNAWISFAQITYRESLRDVEAGLRAHLKKLCHIGILGGVSLNTLAYPDQVRDWRIFADFAQSLLQIARRLYVDENIGVELANIVYALDATTRDRCLSVFPWANFRSTNAAVKLHSPLDLCGLIPTFIHSSDGKMYDIKVLVLLIREPGAFYVMDRGYLDIRRLDYLHQSSAFFVTREKANLQCRYIYSHPIDTTPGLRCDQTIRLTGLYSARNHPKKLRRIEYYDTQADMVGYLFSQQFITASDIDCRKSETLI